MTVILVTDVAYMDKRKPARQRESEERDERQSRGQAYFQRGMHLSIPQLQSQ